MSFAHELMDRAMPIWNQFLTHPFIQQLADGSLDKDGFKRYLIQDTLYLKYFSKVHAQAFIKCDDIEIMRETYGGLKVIVADESYMHIRYLRDLGCSEKEALSTPLAPECQAYVDFMMKTAIEGSVAEGLISLMPCTFSYHFIAKHIYEKAVALGTIEDNYYSDWICDYLGSAYVGMYNSNINLCNRIACDLSDTEKERLFEIFIKSSEYELAFWNIGIQ